MTRAPLRFRPRGARPALPAWPVIATGFALVLAATAASAQDPDHDVAPEQEVPVEPVEAQDERPASPPADAAVDAGAVRREGREAVDALRAYTFQNRGAAVERAQAVLATLDQEAAALEDRVDARWASMDAAARARVRTSLRKVATRRTEAAEWIGGLRHASQAAWGDVREGFQRSQATLGEALRQARTEFGDAPPAPAPEAGDEATDEPDDSFEQDKPDYREPHDAPA
jgi:hypothetical protein